MTRYQPLWQQANSYPAGIDRQLLATLWPVGGVTGGAVTAVANTMNVSVAPGTAAVVLQGGQGDALCRWDAAEIVTLTAAPPSGQTRVDLIVCQVRDATLDGGGNNDFVFLPIAGVPAASGAVAPAVPTNAAAVATVSVAGASANLNTAPIVDQRAPALGTTGPGFEVYNPSLAACSASAWVPLGYLDSNEVRDVGGWHAQVPNSSRFVVPVTGSYLVTGSVNWVPNATGARVCGFMLDGSTSSVLGETAAGGATGIYQAFGQLITLQAGHYIEHVLYQTSGAGLNVQQWRFAAQLMSY